MTSLGGSGDEEGCPLPEPSGPGDVERRRTATQEASEHPWPRSTGRHGRQQGRCTVAAPPHGRLGQADESAGHRPGRRTDHGGRWAAPGRGRAAAVHQRPAGAGGGGRSQRHPAGRAGQWRRALGGRLSADAGGAGRVRAPPRLAGRQGARRPGRGCVRDQPQAPGSVRDGAASLVACVSATHPRSPSNFRRLL